MERVIVGSYKTNKSESAAKRHGKELFGEDFVEVRKVYDVRLPFGKTETLYQAWGFVDC